MTNIDDSEREVEGSYMGMVTWIFFQKGEQTLKDTRLLVLRQENLNSWIRPRNSLFYKAMKYPQSILYMLKTSFLSVSRLISTVMNKLFVL